MSQIDHTIGLYTFRGKELTNNPDNTIRLNNQQDYDEMLTLAITSLSSTIADLQSSIEGLQQDLRDLRLGMEVHSWGEKVSESEEIDQEERDITAMEDETDV